MIRCLKCGKPNAQGRDSCVECGADMPLPENHALHMVFGLRKLAWARVFTVAGALLLLRLLIFPLVAHPPRLELYHLLFYVLQGTALGLGLAWVRKNDLLFFCGAGLVGAMLSYGLDFVYAYNHVGWKATWYTVYFMNNGDGTEATTSAYGLQQLLRSAGLLGVLWLASIYKDRHLLAGMISLVACLCALVLRYKIVGWGLQISIQRIQPVMIAYFYFSVVLVLVGFSLGKQCQRLDAGP